MKRAAYRHPKMFDLADRLKISLSFASGLVQFLLDYTADAAPAGDIGKWSDATIARACAWSGDPTEFVDALVGAGWLDRCAKRRLVVHDLADHAESWWVAKNKKNGISFVKAVSEESPRRKSKLSKVNPEASEPTLRAISGPSDPPISEVQTPLLSPPNTPPLHSPSSLSQAPREESTKPRVEFVKNVEAEANEVSDAFHAKVTRAHTSTGLPEIRGLLLDDVPKSTLLDAVRDAGVWFDRERKEPQMRPSAPKFFGEGGWKKFVKGVPDPVATHGPSPPGNAKRRLTPDEIRAEAMKP